MNYHYGHERGHVGVVLGLFGFILSAGFFLIDLKVVPIHITLSEGTLLIFFAAFTAVLSLVLIGHWVAPEHRY